MLPQINFVPSSLRKPAVAGTLALAALLPTPALADGAEASIVTMVTPRIEILSNGSEYTRAPSDAKLTADIRIKVDAEAAGRVKSWRAWIGLRRDGYPTLWLDNNAVGESYAWDRRPRRIDLRERISVPWNEWTDYPKRICNDLAGELRAQGLKDAAIFGEDRTLELEVPLDYAVTTTGSGSGNIIAEGAGGSTVELVCRKWEGATLPQASSLTARPTKVVDWSLGISETPALSSACKIHLTGAIATDNRNVDVSFRYKDKAGHQSELLTVNTGAAKFATFSHWYDVADGPGPEAGSVRMVGVSHPFQSDWVDYEMNCGAGALTSVNVPKLTLKSVTAEGARIVGEQICPERIRLVGEIEGRGHYSGRVEFRATAGPQWATGRPYDLEPGETMRIEGLYPLWMGTGLMPTGNNDPIILQRSFVLQAINAEKEIVASGQYNAVQVCERMHSPSVGGSAIGSGVQPRPRETPTAVPRLQQQPQPVNPTPQLRMLPAQPPKRTTQ